jgi:aspartate racemase
MKTIGLLGGTTWESTKEYYRVINEEAKKRLGGWNSAQCLLYSVNFAEVLDIQRNKGIDELGGFISAAASRLARGGADFIMLCANTMHRFYEQVKKDTGLEVLHIVDPTAEAIKAEGIKKVGLLGTRITMEEDFIKQRYFDKHGLKIIIPDEQDRVDTNDIIFNELAKGLFKETSKQKFIDVANKLIGKGAGGIILGCTEIPLIISQGDLSVPAFDTGELHAIAAVEKALE